MLEGPDALLNALQIVQIVSDSQEATEGKIHNSGGMTELRSVHEGRQRFRLGFKGWQYNGKSE